MAKIELANSGVIFNEDAHTYTLGGKSLSGITGMLQRQLFPNEFNGIDEAVLNNAAAYGTSVHKSCEEFDREWINDGTQEVLDYIQIVKDNKLVHEESEYTVTDGTDWASNIDKVYRISNNSFILADLKTYGVMTADKLEKAKWQLSIYSYLFELQNKKAKVEKLFIIHLRNKEKKDGSFDHIAELIPVQRIPSEICKELLDTDLRGEQFVNPFAIPDDLKAQEEQIRELMKTKAEAEEKLNAIKASILQRMEFLDIKSWCTETMRLTRKLPSVRSSFDLKLFKSENPDFDTQHYMKSSNVAGSLVIAV